MLFHAPNSSLLSHRLSSTNATTKLLQRRLQDASLQLESRSQSLKKSDSDLEAANEACSNLRAEVNVASTKFTALEHDFQQLSLASEKQKKDLARLSKSHALCQDELKGTRQSLSSIHASYNKEMEDLQNKLFEESERMSENKQAGDIELQSKLAAASKDNAVLQKRLKSANDHKTMCERERENYREQFERLQEEMKLQKEEFEKQASEVEQANR